MHTTNTNHPLKQSAEGMHAATAKPRHGILSAPPYLSVAPQQTQHTDFTPLSDDTCVALWDSYAMPDHIREHSLKVAHIAEGIARCAKKAGLENCVQSVRASALLHDLAKDYTIRYGGNHAQLGGAWVMEETGQTHVAQGVVHHVYWAWKIDIRTHFLPLTVIYADKRVRHADQVSVEERFEDLVTRYGNSEFIRERIEVSRQQALSIETMMTQELGLDISCASF